MCIGASDRRVARRRLALRWLVWAWWRIGLPVLLVLALAIWLLGQVPPASLPAWLKPMASRVHIPLPNSWGLRPATASPPSENTLYGKEP